MKTGSGRVSVVGVDTLLHNGWSLKKLVHRGVELDYECMKGLTGADEGTHSQWLGVLKKSMGTEQYLVDGRYNLLGYWHFVALRENYYKALMKGVFVDSQVTANAIYSLDRPGRYHMYIIEVLLLPSLRDTDAIVMLDDSFYEVVGTFAKRRVYFSDISLNAYTRDGLKRARKLGMRYVTNDTSRGTIYSCSFIDYIKRNAKRHKSLIKAYEAEFGKESAILKSLPNTRV